MVDRPDAEFTGSMSKGVKTLVTMVIYQVGMTVIYVLTTHERLVFADRVAPRFVFDTVRALIVMSFVVFWILVDS